MPNFRGNEDLGKLRKEYLNNLLCKFGPFCLQHSKTFDISHAFLWVTIAELSIAQTGPVFLVHPVYLRSLPYCPYNSAVFVAHCGFDR